jgi:hypothetical protein
MVIAIVVKPQTAKAAFEAISKLGFVHLHQLSCRSGQNWAVNYLHIMFTSDIQIIHLWQSSHGCGSVTING